MEMLNSAHLVFRIDNTAGTEGPPSVAFGHVAGGLPTQSSSGGKIPAQENSGNKAHVKGGGPGSISWSLSR